MCDGSPNIRNLTSLQKYQSHFSSQSIWIRTDGFKCPGKWNIELPTFGSSWAGAHWPSIKAYLFKKKPPIKKLSRSMHRLLDRNERNKRISLVGRYRDGSNNCISLNVTGSEKRKGQYWRKSEDSSICRVKINIVGASGKIWKCDVLMNIFRSNVFALYVNFYLLRLLLIPLLHHLQLLNWT